MVLMIPWSLVIPKLWLVAVSRLRGLDISYEIAGNVVVNKHEALVIFRAPKIFAGPSIKKHSVIIRMIA